jgi:hypothetical protein
MHKRIDANIHTDKKFLVFYETTVTTERESTWVPQPVQTLSKIEQTLAPVRNQNMIPQSDNSYPTHYTNSRYILIILPPTTK